MSTKVNVMLTQSSDSSPSLPVIIVLSCMGGLATLAIILAVAARIRKNWHQQENEISPA